MGSLTLALAYIKLPSQYAYIDRIAIMRGLLALLTVITPPLLKDCGAGKSLFKINSMSLSPVDPMPGDIVTLNLDYTVPDGVVVMDGLTRYDFTYNFLPLSPTIEPLCQNIPCPLASGTYVNKSSSTWPTGLSGSLTTKITWADQDEKQLLCINMAAKL